jgi:glycine/D-amino acid oxidase-like deaminating enzyme
MNRSIDLLEELADATDNAFLMNRRGYLYATADPARAAALAATAEQAAAHGAGLLRRHPAGPGAPAYAPAPAHGYRGQPAGADLLTGQALRAAFPYLAPSACAALHVRRAGWLSGQQLGMTLLGEARGRGARLVTGRVEAVEVTGGRVAGVRLADGLRIATPVFVDAAGPFVADVAALVDTPLPVVSELHRKLAFDDHLGAVPRDAPMLIWDDPQVLPWSDEERAALDASPELSWMAGRLPPGAHLRPEGASPDARTVLVLWGYHGEGGVAVFPLPDDPHFPELALRGVSAMVPGLGAYLERLPRGFVDGGYYTRTPENRPLIGPLGVEGAFVLGALSGYGLMAACGAAELLGAHVTGGALPGYAAAFRADRHRDPAYLARLATWGDTGLL